ncbi:MAG TPA: SdpI family protein [Opitutaceae bacterium]
MQTPRWLKENWLQVAILVAPFFVIVPAWPRVPERIAVHWGTHGLPNGWADKTQGLLMCPLLSIVLALIFGWIPSLDPRLRRNPEANRKSTAVIRLASTALVSGGGVVIALEALGHHLNIPVLAINGMLLFLLILGNLMGTIPPNYFLGVRTPWTLANDAIWRTTHRNCGRILVAGTLVLLLLQCVTTPDQFFGCFIIFLAASIGWPVFYSFRLSRNPGQPGPGEP